MKGRFVADAGVVGAMPDALLVATAARPGGKVLASGSGKTFELDELSEPFTLRVESLPDGWGVKSIVVNGMDVTDTKIELAANQEADVQVVLTNRLTRVTGTVSAEGQPVKAEVVVFAADSAKWSVSLALRAHSERRRERALSHHRTSAGRALSRGGH